MSKHCRAKECPFIGCRVLIDMRECEDCALMEEDDPAVISSLGKLTAEEESRFDDGLD